MEKLIKRIKSQYKGAAAELILRSIDYARTAHEGQKRVSGEDYFSHPAGVAEILVDLNMDAGAVAAAFLHDVVEDTRITETDIRRDFGAEICDLVKGVTKLEQITFKSKEEEQAENMRKMFFAMAEDIRVLLIKLADRLHNMRTVAALSYDRQSALATETIEIYAPLASRLGLSYIKCELEDLSLRVLKPDIYSQLVSDVVLKRAEREQLVNQICETLRGMLGEMGLRGDVSGRPKHFYSIYKKMLARGRTFDQIYDLTAVRVILETVNACYEVLGRIHTLWKPIPGRFKDYIAVPKPNNYQSLHTTVMTNYGTPFEIQIRTFEMHKTAEYGIAAHWKYKEKRENDTLPDSKLSWLRDVIAVQGEMPSSKDFLESFKHDLFAGQVFVFTPKGDVVPLTEGSTPVDFAYSVHSEIGNRCVSAKINNKIVPLATKLQSGDYVEIITSSAAKGPSRDWLSFVKTTGAKAKIRAWFKKQMKDENIKLGKEMLELEAKRHGYNFSQLFSQSGADIVLQRFSFMNTDDMFAAVGYGGISVRQIVPKLIEFFKTQAEKPLPLGQTAPVTRAYKEGISVLGHDDLLVRLARCCSPVPGDEIIGFVSRGRGVAVHRAACPNVAGMEQERLVDVAWTDAAQSFTASFQITAANVANLLLRVTTALSELKVNIESMNARTSKSGKAVINIQITVNKTAQLDALIRKIKNIDVVENVHRTTI